MNLVNILLNIIFDLKEKEEKKGVKVTNTDCLNKILDYISKLSFGTHIPKFTHPNSKFTAINISINEKYLQNSKKIPYACTGNSNIYIDATNNAAWFTGAKFLLESDDNGKNLYSFLILKDYQPIYELFEQLGIGFEDRNRILNCFKLNITTKIPNQSFLHLKQVYFPKNVHTKDDLNDYFLLIPLYSSSFVHDVYFKVKYRYSEHYKNINDKFKKNEELECLYTPINKLGMLEYGGTKPGNISYNNSKRKKSYLLSNLPPIVETYTWCSPDDKRCRKLFQKSFNAKEQLRCVLYKYKKHNKLNNKKSYQEFILNVGYLAIEYLHFLEEHLYQISNFDKFSKNYQCYFIYLKDRSLCSKDDINEFILDVSEYISFLIATDLKKNNIDNIDDALRKEFRNFIKASLRSYIYNEKEEDN